MAATSERKIDLAPFDVEALQTEPSTIYAVGPDLRINFVNDAYAQFARANGARWNESEWGIGTPILDAIPQELRRFHEKLFERAATTGTSAEYDYDCSTATMTRRFRMRVLPCASGALLVVHSLIRETPNEEPSLPPIEALYRRSGMLLQCSHCRRVQRADDANTWDWVPAYAEKPQPNTSHGLCRLCCAYYYPEDI